MTLRQDETSPLPQKSTRRVKTRYVGVYCRESSVRLDENGRPDKCFDISWCTKEGKMKWEKVGWKTEGYTIYDAVALRGMRIKSNRHPELEPQLPKAPIDCTLQEAWSSYKAQWLPRLSGARAVENRYHCYLEKRFKNLKISEITTLEIQKFTEELLGNRSQKTLKGLEPSTVNTIISDLRRIIKKAYEWGLYKGEMPFFHRLASDDCREKFLTSKEANLFLTNLLFIDCNLYYIAKISLFTGMRLDEILGLTPSDVNLASKLIYITKHTKQQGKRVANKRFAIIPEDLLKDVEYLLSKKNSYLFINSKKKKWSSSRMSAIFGKTINAMGFNDNIKERKYRFVFHSLRHTFCSWLAIKGVPIYTIKELAGHSAVEMTQRYAKLSPDIKQEAMKYIHNTLSEDKGN